MSKKHAKIAFEKGYRMTPEGDLIGPRGKRTPVVHSKGYYGATIKHEGRDITFKYHGLQAYQKYGEVYMKKGVVARHIDGNSFNNHRDNIKIGTHSDNMMDKPAEQRSLDASNPKHDHAAIIEDRKRGMTYKEIMQKYNISSKGTVSFIINKSLVSV